MDITQMKTLVAATGFILIFVSGFWLNKTGQPFSAGVLTLHKLLSVALIVYLVITVLNINKIAPLSQGELIACIVTGLLFLGAVVSGGVLSAVKNLSVVVQTLHMVLSVLTVLSTVVLFLLFRRR